LPDEYAEEARFIEEALRRHVEGPLESLLELGSGGGNTASHLKRDLRQTLTDIAEPMLDLSRGLNPECEHVAGDMRSLRFDRTFDAVLVHDAVMYMTSAADLRSAMATAAVHLRPGGAAIFLPDVVRETFAPKTEHGGHDGAGRALRFLSWSYDPDPEDSTLITDFTMVLRVDPDTVRIRYDRHVEGLFGERDWPPWGRIHPGGACSSAGRAADRSASRPVSESLAS
jgi:SAM-dependent methyltransferase